MKGDWRRKYTQKYEVCLGGKYLGKEERDIERAEKFYNHFS